MAARLGWTGGGAEEPALALPGAGLAAQPAIARPKAMAQKRDRERNVIETSFAGRT
jgi:hypothetical protein